MKSTRQKRNRQKLKNTPKRNRSAYMFYTEEVRQAIRLENPTVAFGEVSRAAADRWKQLSPDKRRPYEDMASRDRERYERDLASYKPEQPHIERVSSFNNGSQKREKKDKNAPKGALSAYFVYSSELRDQIREQNPEMSLGSVAKLIGERWQALSTEEKAVYEEKSEKDKERYASEMIQYLNAKATSEFGASLSIDEEALNEDPFDVEMAFDSMMSERLESRFYRSR